MHVDPNSPRATLTKRQQEVLERLREGLSVRQIAADVGISRNAVYGHIERLRERGALAASYTPSGQPPRRPVGVGAAAPAPAPSPGGALASLRELALAGEADEAAYAKAIEAAIASGDGPGLAYELGRLDAGSSGGLPSELVAAALRRLGLLPGYPGSAE